MEIIAKELADTGEIGLDEQTLLKLFDFKTERLLNMSNISNQFTFEDNLNQKDPNYKAMMIQDQQYD